MNSFPEAVNRTDIGFAPGARPSSLALRFGVSYILFTMGLFVFGPFTWPLPSLAPVLVYLVVLVAMLCFGHMIGVSRPALHAPMRLTRVIFVVGAVSALLLLLPSSITYTGRWPWQVFEALADQREAYGMLREQLGTTAGNRGPLIALRALTYPFVFAVLPLGCLYWRNLTTVQRVLLAGTVLSSIIFSVLRGTTRELADVVVIGGSASLVAMQRQAVAQTVKPVRSLAFFALLGLLAAGVVTALVFRTVARSGDVVTQMSGCIGDTRVCTDYSRVPFNVLPAPVSNVSTILTGYLSQGYYGLGLALDSEFVWTNGVGHSPALTTLYEIATDDSIISRETYPSRLSVYGWSSESQWASLPTWLASDLSFWLVPGFFLIFGYAWIRTWADATIGNDDRAAIFFCALMMMIFYFPANNQMMNTLDNYTVLVGWGLAWGLTRRNAARLAQ